MAGDNRIKEVREIWGEFANFVACVDMLMSKLVEPFGTIKNRDDFIIIDSSGSKMHRRTYDHSDLERIERIQASLKSYRIVMRKFDPDRAYKSILNFEVLLKDPEYQEFQKTFFSYDLKSLLETALWYKMHYVRLTKLVDYFYSNPAKKILRTMDEYGNIFEPIRTYYGGGSSRTIIPELDGYNDKSFSQIRKFILEIEALENTKLLDTRNINKAVNVCKHKLVRNIYAPGLLIHNTKSSMWHPETLYKLIKKGLLPSGKDIAKEGFTLFHGYFSMYMLDSTKNKEFYEGEAAFIIDSDYAMKNRRHFFYYQNAFNSDEFMNLCRSYGLTLKRIEGGNVPWENEVQCDIPVPISAIKGLVIKDPMIRKRLKFFMLKLAQKHPELTFPVYWYNTGELIWPEKI